MGFTFRDLVSWVFFFLGGGGGGVLKWDFNLVLGLFQALQISWFWLGLKNEGHV